jgi:hypothetical protein
MSVPQDISDRLLALNHAPERYEELVRSEGADFVRCYVAKLEEADHLFHEWSPKLREFAADCRAKTPLIDAASLNPRDNAKLAIYESLITKAEQQPQQRRNEVLICSIPRLGMPIAMSLWPATDDRCVFLTPDELSEWRTIYEHHEESFWWFANYWWHIEDPPRTNSLWEQDTELNTSDGADPWLVVSGLSWGSLAGGETADLWSWDGRQARFVRNVGICSF